VDKQFREEIFKLDAFAKMTQKEVFAKDSIQCNQALGGLSLNCVFDGTTCPSSCQTSINNILKNCAGQTV
jgi:hypothetical protein